MRVSGRSALRPIFIFLSLSAIVAFPVGTAPRAFGQSVPIALERLRDLVDDWWEGVPDGQELARVGLEASLLFFALSFAGWRGVRGLRRWQGEGEPPFWRRASSAAGVVLLRAAPVSVPVVFAYAMLATQQHLPDRLDWLFYLTAEMVVIIFTVAALVTTTLAPRALECNISARRTISAHRPPDLRCDL